MQKVMEEVLTSEDDDGRKKKGIGEIRTHILYYSRW